jgi:hypothetical protein
MFKLLLSHTSPNNLSSFVLAPIRSTYMDDEHKMYMSRYVINVGVHFWFYSSSSNASCVWKNRRRRRILKQTKNACNYYGIVDYWNASLSHNVLMIVCSTCFEHTLVIYWGAHITAEMLFWSDKIPKKIRDSISILTRLFHYEKILGMTQSDLMVKVRIRRTFWDCKKLRNNNFCQN